jgi:RNA ligase (TIGR02306 family)
MGHQASPCARKDINPNFHKYTGIENFKNYPDVFEGGQHVVITEKIHGSNFRAGWVPAAADTWFKRVKKFFGLLPEYEFVYGSHNVQLTNKLIYDGFYAEQGNIYAKTVVKYDLKNRLDKGQVVYGEIYGAGIQKNYTYGSNEHKLIVFDIMENGQYKSPLYCKTWCDCMGLDHVPVLYSGPFSVEIAKMLTQGPSVLCPDQKVREGVVIKSADPQNHPKVGRAVLKLISDAYLLDKNNSDNH